MSYDVFISHRSDDKPWVRTLASNLQKSRLDVFFDEWGLVAGESLVQGLERGLSSSKSGVIVCTPGALESDWVRKEYDFMLGRGADRNDGFRIVPVVLDPNAPKFPFLKSIHHVDFSRRVRYRESFARLLSGLQGEPPGPNPSYSGELKIPDYSDYEKPLADDSPLQARAWVDEVMELLFHESAVVMPAPDGRLDGSQNRLIMDKASESYGEQQAFQIMPPAGSGKKLTVAERREYFGHLGRQCKFTAKIDSGRALTEQFADLMQDRRELFVLVSGFDHGHPDGRAELASSLRGLLELDLPFRLVLTGGEDLCELFFVVAEHSLLNHAKYMPCPELGLDDVRRLLTMLHPQLEIRDDVVEQVAAVSGRHPRLIKHCSTFVTAAGFDRDQAFAKIVAAPELLRSCLPIVKNDELHEQVAKRLSADEVGPWQDNLIDPVDRRLYWAGLLRRGDDGRRLIWRCPAIRQALKGIVGGQA